MPCYRICQFRKSSDYNGMVEARKWWEEWDLRILILYILIAQFYLHFFGRLRRRNKSVFMMIVSVWLLYLFSDLLATIALGKLSKIKVDDKADSTKPKGNSNTLGEQSLRVLWAPLILFYLGGPDTITVLRVEENQLWLRHLIGLLTQGFRTAYALVITWNSKDGLSLLAALVFIPGIIKYGERVWVVRSRSNDYEGFVKLDLNRIDKIRASRPHSHLVLQAYSCFQTLLPHNTSYMCDASKVRNLVTRFRNLVKSDNIYFDAFKLIEVELGLMYDMLFSKIGTIFTVLGSVLRFLSFSMIVSVLVIYLKCKKPQGYSEVDHIVTIIVLAGAIFLEIAGIFVQLLSDWAMVWAWKNGSRWATSILFLHEFRSSKSPRWSGLMGQFSLREFCKHYKPNACNKTWEGLFGREKMLTRFSLQKSPDQNLKETIIRHLLEKSEKVTVADTLCTSTEIVANVDTSQTSSQIIATGKVANVDDTLPTSTEKNANVDDTLPTSTEKNANVDKLLTSGVKRGEWTLGRYNLGEQFKSSIELAEFGQSIVIWHVATEVCYESDRPKFFGKDTVKLKAAKMLSDYMMYLLVACSSRFPFCDKYNTITKDYADMKKLFDGGGVTDEVGNEGNTTNITLINEAQKLVLHMKENPKRWDIMGSMWAEMLCYAAKKCPVKNHIQELRNGGEFLTHVWLLLMHFGVTNKLERSTVNDGTGKRTRGRGNEIADDEGEKDQWTIEAPDEEGKEDMISEIGL